MNRLSLNKLKKHLSYNPETGVFTYVQGPHSGQTAGYQKSNGYSRISINGVSYHPQSLAFLWMKKRWPKERIYPENGDYCDLRWSNLRVCSKHQYASKLGEMKGITARSNGWMATISVKGKPVYIGTFNTVKGAQDAYREMSERLYGKLARIPS